MERIKRRIIEIDEELCDGCGQCAIACAEGAIEIRDGKARVVSESYCDGLGACIGECPRGALRLVEREAEPFDEEAVRRRMEEAAKAAASQCACPSAAPSSVKGGGLSNWPVQLRLVPPEAPFLKGADILMAADCTLAACPDFHRRILDGRVLLLGCPKFDGADEYAARLARILAEARPSSLTVSVMEVPCCGALVRIAQEAERRAGSRVPLRVLRVGVKGEVEELQGI